MVWQKPKQNQLSNMLSENQLVTDLRQQMPLDNVMGNESISLETTNQNVQSRTKSSEMPSLLDVDDAAQTLMSSKPDSSGELPSLPAEFGESPGSHVTEGASVWHQCAAGYEEGVAPIKPCFCLLCDQPGGEDGRGETHSGCALQYESKKQKKQSSLAIYFRSYQLH